MSEDPDFKYIIRIANSDVSGEQRLGYALTSIRGIGSRISNAIIQKLKLDSEKLAGELTDKDIENIENAIENVNDFVPNWLLNRQKDYDTGKDIHPVSIDLKMLHEISKSVKDAKSGQVKFKNDKSGIVHAGVGKIDLSEEDLLENIKTFYSSVSKSKPDAVKGSFIKKVTIASTMGVGLNINQASLR